MGTPQLKTKSLKIIFIADETEFKSWHKFSLELTE